ncbi:hypothetical protein ABMD26_003869 [Pseudomonas sp. PvP001]
MSPSKRSLQPWAEMSQQLADQGVLESAAGDLDVHQLRKLECGAKGVASLVIDHLTRQRADIAAATFLLGDGPVAMALPRHAHTVMKAFDLERLAGLQVFFAFARDHFVEHDAQVVSVHFHQEALAAQGAVLEGDDQGVMAFLKQAQVGGDFQRCSQYLGRLRSVFQVRCV